MAFGQWVFPQTGSYQVQGRDLSEDNFAHEERSNLELLMREILQNPLDARSSANAGAIRVNIRVLKPGEFDADYLSELLPNEYIERLVASGAEFPPDLNAASVLVLEDYGTTGLQGAWQDPNADGPTENWNAFWFREGEGAKSATGSNGRAGQGKITYYRIGGARAVFGLTVRASDGKKLLMGRGAFRRVYPLAGQKFLRHSFWCVGENTPLPVSEEKDLQRFEQAFRLERGIEPGLSLVIPLPTDFQAKIAIQTVVSEFYFPIAAGKLDLTIGGMQVNAANIESVAKIALTDDDARQKKSCFTAAFRSFAAEIVAAEKNDEIPCLVSDGWDKSASLSEEFFPEGAIAAMREQLEKGGRVSARFPIQIRPKKGKAIKSHFDVHLQLPEDLDRAEEVYVRKDLLIGSEKHLASNAHLQKARAATMVREQALSAFLADAEEPTHLKWNGSRPRLAEEYSNPQATLRAVRNAAPRLLAVLSNGLIARDVKALAKYFTNPAVAGKPSGGGNRKSGQRVKPIVGDPPEPIKKPLRIQFGADRLEVVPNGPAALTFDGLPLECTLEMAYEGLDQNPFDAYDPFDFDLGTETNHPIAIEGAEVKSRQGNRVEFQVTSPNFRVAVQGFDPNIRLRARLTYKEERNGTTVSEE